MARSWPKATPRKARPPALEYRPCCRTQGSLGGISTVRVRRVKKYATGESLGRLSSQSGPGRHVRGSRLVFADFDNSLTSLLVRPSLSPSGGVALSRTSPHARNDARTFQVGKASSASSRDMSQIGGEGLSRQRARHLLFSSPLPRRSCHTKALLVPGDAALCALLAGNSVAIALSF